MDAGHELVRFGGQDGGRWLAAPFGWRQPQSGEGEHLAVLELDVHRLPIAPFVESGRGNQAPLCLAEHPTGGEGLRPRIDRRRPLLRLVEPEGLEPPDGHLRKWPAERLLDNRQDFL